MDVGLDDARLAPRWRDRRRWLVAAVAVLGSCADTCGDSSDRGAVGELGNGRFHYICGGDNDPACEFSTNDEQPDDFPECIVLGGFFDLEYTLLDDSALETGTLTPVIYVESVNQSFFRGTDDFEALRTGEAAFIVRESDYVLDLIHLAVVRPDSIEVLARDPATPTDSVVVELGDTEQLRVLPRSEQCTQLGGAIPITANSSDETIASTSAGDILRIQGNAVGMATVRVQLGDLEASIAVEVVEGSIPPDPDDSSTGASGETDASSGTTGSSSGSDETDGTAGSSTGGSTSGGAR